MAERRMFAKTIIDSDAFLEMPQSTQLLYFHLAMRADDDGFVNSPKSIMRIVGAKNDDLYVLTSKKFIIPFDNGIVVIKHWRIHNYIQKDRYVPTKYLEQKELLNFDENNAYTLEEGSSKEKTALTTAQQKRLDAKRESDLPYSFEYKIRRAFIGELCPICGCQMGIGIRDDSGMVLQTPKPTIQHNIPISKGGKHDIENISVICSSCNHSIIDKETGSLNNALVKQKWQEIQEDERNGYIPDTQYRLDKDSIDKIRLGKPLVARRQSKIPPSFQEVDEYCKERNNGIDAQEFIDFYTSKGWVVGKSPMKDWKAAVRTWEGKRKAEQPKKQTVSDMDEAWLRQYEEQERLERGGR